MRNIEFASRWRKKLAPLEVAYGNLLQHDYAVSKRGKNSSEYYNQRLEKDKNELQRQARRTRKNYKINKDPVVNEDLNNRIYKSKKVSISATGKEKLKQLKSAYSKRKVVANIGKAKKFLGNNKGKLRAIGLATASVISYGLYRKLRSDKGRKRGRYK